MRNATFFGNKNPSERFAFAVLGGFSERFSLEGHSLRIRENQFARFEIFAQNESTELFHAEHVQFHGHTGSLTDANAVAETGHPDFGGIERIVDNFLRVAKGVA